MLLLGEQNVAFDIVNTKPTSKHFCGYGPGNPDLHLKLNLDLDWDLVLDLNLDMGLDLDLNLGLDLTLHLDLTGSVPTCIFVVVAMIQNNTHTSTMFSYPK